MGARWRRLPDNSQRQGGFLSTNQSILVLGPGHPQRAQYISADFFQRLEGAPAETDGVFLYHAASTWAYTPEAFFGVLFLNRLYRFPSTET